MHFWQQKLFVCENRAQQIAQYNTNCLALLTRSLGRALFFRIFLEACTNVICTLSYKETKKEIYILLLSCMLEMLRHGFSFYGIYCT